MNKNKKRLHQIKDAILGPDYDLSLAFINNRRSRILNRRYRQKNNPADILSFPLERRVGEILLNRERVSEKKMIPLFIHGLLHLKGMVHGSKMEREEKKFSKLFSNANGQNSHRGTRHRHRRHPADGRRSINTSRRRL